MVSAAERALRDANEMVTDYLDNEEKEFKNEQNHEANPRFYALDFSELSDLEQIPVGIMQCTSLGALALSGPKVTDLSPIRGLSWIRILRLSATPITSLISIAHFTLLTELECDGTGIETLIALRDMHFLERLSIRDTEVSNLRPLVLVQQLRYLDLHKTKVTDLSPIRKCLDLRSLIKLRLRAVTQTSDLPRRANHQCNAPHFAQW